MDWSQIGLVCLREILPVLAVILAGILSTLGAIAIQAMRKKWGLAITEAQEDAIDVAICDAIAYAEEQARKLLNAGVKKESILSSDKMEDAVTHYMAEAKRLGLPELARDAIVRLIEARIEGVRS